MCNPAAFMAISAGIAAASAIQQGKAAQAAADYNAEVDKNNAAIRQSQADDALKRGDIEEQRHRVRISQKVGEQRSALAGSGVELDSGSALDVIGDTSYVGAQEISDIQQNARREAFGYQVGATDALASSRLNKASGKNAASASILTAGSAVAKGASNYYGAA